MRVYPVLARNDLSDNLLQFVDVVPNTSLATGQQLNGCNTGYLTWDAMTHDVSATPDMGGTFTTDAVSDGLSAYLIDNIENVGGGGLILSPIQANVLANAIVNRVRLGLSLTLVNINTLINALAGGGGFPAVTLSDLNGVVAGSDSTGSVEEILRILAGEVYRIEAGVAVSAAAAAFITPHVKVGAFLTAADHDFRDARVYRWTGSMNLSCLSGQLSKLKQATYAWINPAFTYGAAGTALTISGTHVGTNGEAAGAFVYLDNGTVL